MGTKWQVGRTGNFIYSIGRKFYSYQIDPYECEKEVSSLGELSSLRITTQLETLRIRSTKMYSNLKVRNSLHFKKFCPTAARNGLQKKYVKSHLKAMEF